MDISRFDLNLLKTLDMLERERSVQLSAARLNVTPSAVSHALARLRRALGDPLFSRTGQELVPTQRCRDVLGQIRPFLSSVSLALDAERDRITPFDPAMDRRSLTIVLPGAVELSLLPVLTAHLAQKAPGWELTIRGFERRSYATDLLSGEADIVLSVGGHTTHGTDLWIAPFWQDELVVLQGPNGPLPPDRPITLDEAVTLPQLYCVPWPREQNYLDIRLARDGRRRPIALSLPGYAAAGEALIGTGLIAILPDRTALRLLARHGDLHLIRIAPSIHLPLSIETSQRFRSSTAGAWILSELLAMRPAVPCLPKD